MATVRLGDLVDEARPGFATGDRDDDGVLQLRIGAVTSTGTVDWTKAVRVPPPPDLSRYVLSPGDVLFNNTNSQELVGRGSLVMDVPATAAYSNHITRLRCGPRLDPGYLVFWLNARWRSGFFFQFAQRWIGQAAIQTGRLLDLEIPLPPLDEQRRIAARLRDQVGAVADFGPSIDQATSALATLRRSALATTFEQLLMERRSVGTLADVVKLRNDIVHPKDRPTGTAVFVGLEHIEAGSGRRIGQLSIDLAAMTGRKARFLPGDIVYGYLRPYLNKVWLADLDGFCSVDQYVLSVDGARADAGFVAMYILSDAYLSRAPIATTPGQLPRIRSGEVLSVPVPLTLLDEQRRIAARLREQLTEIDRAKTALEAQRAAIDAMPAALLRDVFRAEDAASGGGH